ncbi:esterase-like activity of phytase family protein [Rhodococcus triatomae]|uniref:Uncharacterized conserved protein n=1 Tax=Rhodococcus triatomae TaxID=300028 RepID=A0A1G8A5I8_9NOCA|nr:esterase-like activity of phytase family protein [Rhodococcus triatomae]QNG17853.1 esterase-like activity of phytase family protein [Rhodococcus triatomae]QNG22479.1 esterase-like activity of phytase family protein [Rhodococcus triatomae]SDH16141.1 Uncharacterized conserved protein [Rhodococcus triatomae]
MSTSRILVTVLLSVLPFGIGSLDAGSTGSGVGDDRVGRIDHLDTLILPPGTALDGVPVGGLSGIDYTPEAGFVVISDDRGEVGPVRMYTLSLPIDDGVLGEPQFLTRIDLLDRDGAPFPPRSADTESVRWAPGADGVLYTSEGEAQAGLAGFVREAGLDGGYRTEVPLPDAYTPRLDESGGLVSGIRDNLGFEAMDLVRDGAAVVAVTENALVQDGPEAGPDVESPARLLEIDRGSGAVLGEYIYPVDRVAPGALPQATGVSEVLAVGDRSYLTLERSLFPETGLFTGRIYETSTAEAENVAGEFAVSPDTVRMDKRLLFDFASAGVDPQCVEGMTWGPRLPDGRRSLVVVSDDNFGVAGQTAFHLLAVSEK